MTALRKQIVRYATNKASYAKIGENEYYFRSAMERNYARWLQFQLERGYIHWWAYEPHTFWFEGIKRGVRSYKPDFLITNVDGSRYYAEVKGYMDSKSKTKISRFNKYYPDERLIVIDNKWFKKNKENLRFIITDME